MLHSSYQTVPDSVYYAFARVMYHYKIKWLNPFISFVEKDIKYVTMDC